MSCAKPYVGSSLSSDSGVCGVTSSDTKAQNMNVTVKASMSEDKQVLVPPSKLECDYDRNPTVLYQALEAKQWDYAASLFDIEAENCSKQAATWVVRKETNGKLRWRLLPLHAAVIFGSPIKLIERLLVVYPAGAQCKDDQGMLPLHLSFRNESSWEIIEELLTAYPQAIFVKDRKARTPLQCGTRSLSSGTSISSHNNMNLDTLPFSKSFKSVISVLDLFTQIAVSGERQRAIQESRNLMEARVQQLQDTHLQTLTTLKREWQTQSEESKAKMMETQLEKEVLQQKFQAQQIDLSVTKATQKDLTDKLRSVTLALQHANEKNASNGNVEHYKKTNQTLRAVVEDLVDQQKQYHGQFQDLMRKYEKLMDERKQAMAVFTQQTNEQTEKETSVVKNFKNWLADRETKLAQQKNNLGEEKKVEEVLDYVQRNVIAKSATNKISTTAIETPMSPPAPVGPAIIDLSHVPSPREDASDRS